MNRHRTDVTSLVFGLFFLGVCVLWGLVEYGVMSFHDLRVAAPLFLVAIGMAGLMALVGTSRRGSQD